MAKTSSRQQQLTVSRCTILAATFCLVLCHQQCCHQSSIDSASCTFGKSNSLACIGIQSGVDGFKEQYVYQHIGRCDAPEGPALWHSLCGTRCAVQCYPSATGLYL